MTPEQLVEVRPIATGEASGAAHVAACTPKHLFEVRPIEGLASLSQCRKRTITGVVPIRNQHDGVLVLYET